MNKSMFAGRLHQKKCVMCASTFISQAANAKFCAACRDHAYVKRSKPQKNFTPRVQL